MIAIARSRLFLTLALLLAVSLTGGADEPKAWVDIDGAPLPEGVIARLGSAKWRISGPASRAELSKDGKYLALNGEHGVVSFHDTDTGRPVSRIQLAPFNGSFQGMLPDSRHFLTLSGELWLERSILDGEVVRKGKLPLDRVGQSLSADGTAFLVRMAENEVIRLDRFTGKRTTLSESSKFADASPSEYRGAGLVLNPANRQNGQSVRVVDSATQRVVLERKDDPRTRSPLVFAASPDNSRFILGSREPLVRREVPLEIYNAADGKKIATLDDGRFLDKGGLDLYDEAAFAPNRPEVYLSGPSGIQVRDAITGAALRRLVPEGSVSRFFLHPDDATMVILDDSGHFRRIDLDTGRTVRGLAAESGFSGFASETSVVAVREGRIRVTDFRTGKDLEVGRSTVPPFSPALPLAISADRRRVVFVGAAEKRRGFSNRLLPQLVDYDDRSGMSTTIPSGMQVGSMALAPDGRTLILGGWMGRSVGIFDLNTGEFSPGLTERQRDNVGIVALSPSGRLVAWEAWDSGGTSVSASDRQSRREVLRVNWPKERPEVLAFSPDDKYLAVVPGKVDVYDLATGKLFGSFGGNNRVNRVAFAADGRSLATAADDGTVRIWEMSSGSQRLLLPVTPQTHDGLWFSPSGALLATRSNADGVLIHDIYGKQRPTAPALDDAGAADAVRELGSNDASAAFAAMRRLVASPSSAVRALGDTVVSSKPPAAKVVDGWLADLESDDSAVLESALANLRQHASELELRLKKARSATRESDVQDRLDELLKGADRVTPAWLRLLRGIEVLEQIGTPEARKLLESLSADGDTRRTREAKASLGRLK